MSNINSSLQKKIMRHIYYAFAWRLTLHPLTLLSLVGMVSLYLLARLVFVAKIVQAFLATPIGHLPQLTYSIVSHADWPTLLVSIVFGLVMVAFVKQLAAIRLAPQKHPNFSV